MVMDTDVKKLVDGLRAKIEKLEKQLGEVNEKAEGYASACATLLANVDDLKDVRGGTNEPVGYWGSDLAFSSRVAKQADLMFQAVSKRRQHHT